MPAPLTVQQIALYMSKRRAGSRQEVAAAAAGISVSSAHRIDSGRLQPKAAKPRGRRRPDPLAEVWEPLLLPLLERHPALTPTTLLEHLQEQKPDQDWNSLKRTLQRRVQHWKSLHGPAPEVMFPLAYQPGEIGFCDFTKVKRVEITLRGEPFPHLLFHYRLAWSGWAYGQLIHGGESFVALSEGLQNALAACGGVPRELRTDRLSAASRNRDGSFALDIAPRYQALCAHYGLSPSRNNRGVAHENGIVEAPHGHVKRRLEQKLILRGSCDFEEPAEYGELLAEVFSALNAPRQQRYEQDLVPGLQRLISGDTGQVSEQAIPIDPGEQCHAQAAVNADGALEQADRSGGDREDQLVAEATQQGHGAWAGPLRVPMPPHPFEAPKEFGLVISNALAGLVFVPYGAEPTGGSRTREPMLSMDNGC